MPRTTRVRGRISKKTVDPLRNRKPAIKRAYSADAITRASSITREQPANELESAKSPACSVSMIQPQDKSPIFHHQIYDILVNIASHLGTYAHRAARSHVPGDITSFQPWQRDWGPNPEDRPHILNLWAKPSEPYSPADPIGVMRYNGRDVIDWEGTPIRHFDNLPDTISSEVEGWRMEAWMRLDPRIKVKDILARVRTAMGPDRKLVPLILGRVVSSRTSRFRERNGLLNWSRRADVQAKKNFFDSLRTPDQIANNLSISRHLTVGETAQMRLIGLDTRKRYLPQGESHRDYVEGILARASVFQKNNIAHATQIQDSVATRPDMQVDQPLEADDTGMYQKDESLESVDSTEAYYCGTIEDEVNDSHGKDAQQGVLEAFHKHFHAESSNASYSFESGDLSGYPNSDSPYGYYG